MKSLEITGLSDLGLRPPPHEQLCSSSLLGLAVNIMAGGEEPPPGIELKGWGKTFNSYTKTGRANVAMATYGAIFAFIAVKKLYNYTKVKVEEAKCDD